MENKQEFYTRLGFDFKINESEEWDKFVNRVSQIILDESRHKDSYREKIKIFERKLGKKSFFSLLQHVMSFEELKEYFEALNKIDFLYELQLFIDIFKSQSLFSEIKDVFEISSIDFDAILINGNNIQIYRKGEKFLDQELVEKPLGFLESESLRCFKNSLDEYNNKKWRESCEAVRMCLEEFLKLKLNNTKNLKNNIDEVLSKINNIKQFQGKNKISEINNLIKKELEYLDCFFNANSKHNSGDIDENEVEYIIYQAGVTMRYINKLLKN